MNYLGAGQSVERLAAESANVVVCKSMSKAYALSGLRAAYLCGPPPLMAELRAITPPWVVGMAAQVAAVRALADPGYYAERYRQTHALREELAAGLSRVRGLDVIPGAANFLLVHLPEDGPDAAAVVEACRQRGVYVRDAGGMGRGLGQGPRSERGRGGGAGCGGNGSSARLNGACRR